MHNHKFSRPSPFDKTSLFSYSGAAPSYHPSETSHQPTSYTRQTPDSFQPSHFDTDLDSLLNKNPFKKEGPSVLRNAYSYQSDTSTHFNSDTTQRENNEAFKTNRPFTQLSRNDQLQSPSFKSPSRLGISPFRTVEPVTLSPYKSPYQLDRPATEDSYRPVQTNQSRLIGAPSQRYKSDFPSNYLKNHRNSYERWDNHQKSNYDNNQYSMRKVSPPEEINPYLVQTRNQSKLYGMPIGAAYTPSSSSNIQDPYISKVPTELDNKKYDHLIYNPASKRQDPIPVRDEGYNRYSAGPYRDEPQDRSEKNSVNTYINKILDIDVVSLNGNTVNSSRDFAAKTIHYEGNFRPIAQQDIYQVESHFHRDKIQSKQSVPFKAEQEVSVDVLRQKSNPFNRTALLERQMSGAQQSLTKHSKHVKFDSKHDQGNYGESEIYNPLKETPIGKLDIERDRVQSVVSEYKYEAPLKVEPISQFSNPRSQSKLVKPGPGQDGIDHRNTQYYEQQRNVQHHEQSCTSIAIEPIQNSPKTHLNLNAHTRHIQSYHPQAQMAESQNQMTRNRNDQEEDIEMVYFDDEPEEQIALSPVMQRWGQSGRSEVRIEAPTRLLFQGVVYHQLAIV